RRCARCRVALARIRRPVHSLVSWADAARVTTGDLMRTPGFALLATMLAVASATAQEYRWEKSDALHIKFRVHRKLQPVPIQIGSADPHTKVRYEADDVADRIRGMYSWELYVLEFPKQSAAPAASSKPGEGGTTTEPTPEKEGSDRLRAANFHEWVTEKDPS